MTAGLKINLIFKGIILVISALCHEGIANIKTNPFHLSILDLAFKGIGNLSGTVCF